MDTTIKCCNCDREMGLAEFLTYPEAYLTKLIAPVLVSYFIGLMTQKLLTQTKWITDGETRGFIDGNMAGLAKNFSIACPNCGKINWYPASGPKPKEVKGKSKQAVV